jgi:adiponectin receptor
MLSRESENSDQRDAAQGSHVCEKLDCRSISTKHAQFVSVPRLLSFKEAPAWEQDNEYILDFYRPPFGDWRQCFYSWCYIHNQSGNIYTHLAAFVFFLCLYTHVFMGMYQDNGCISDILSLLPVALGCLGVLFFSTLFHTMRCENFEHTYL